MQFHEAFPLFEHGHFREKGPEVLDLVNLRRRLPGRQAQTVIGERPGGYGPEFHEFLRGDTQNFIPAAPRVQCALGEAAMWMMRLKKAEENVGVGEDRHYIPRVP